MPADVPGPAAGNCERFPQPARSADCDDPNCPHDPADCPDYSECAHFHNEPDIPVPVTTEMVEAAELLGATGAELLGHALRRAVEGER